MMFGLALLLSLISGSVDLTRIAGTIGEDVVDATINQIKDTCIFQNDYLFLKRLAFVNSNYGTTADTYRPGYDGGIWQVDLSQYDETLVGVSSNDIQAAFGIDWLASNWTDLRKPLFSGIAMMLLIEKRTVSVPKTILAQAWMYENELNGNKQRFENEVSTMPTGCLADNLDMAFLIDASGSIQSNNYETSKQFVADILDSFTIDTDKVRLGVTRFSTAVNTHVYFSDHNSKAALQQMIMDLPYDSRGTNTGAAIDHLRTVVFTTDKGMRQESAKIAIIQTDGRSNNKQLTLEAAPKLRDEGVTVFAIGVGSGIDENELIGIATSPTCRHVREIDDFDELDSIIADINNVACDTIIKVDDEIDADLTCNHTVTMSIEIAEGKTLGIVGDGIPDIEGSFNYTHPSSAFYDFKVKPDTSIPTMMYFPASGETVYLTFDTSNCTGEFFMQVQKGKRLKKTGADALCLKNGAFEDCAEIDYVTSNNFTTDSFADNFCASKSEGYHSHPDSTLKYIYCDTQESYTVDCPAGFAYFHDLKDCSIPASTEADQICNVCTTNNLRMNLLSFPLPSNKYQYVECSDIKQCELKECLKEYDPAAQECKDDEDEKVVSAFCKFLYTIMGTMPAWC